MTFYRSLNLSFAQLLYSEKVINNWKMKASPIFIKLKAIVIRHSSNFQSSYCFVNSLMKVMMTRFQVEFATFHAFVWLSPWSRNNFSQKFQFIALKLQRSFCCDSINIFSIYFHSLIALINRGMHKHKYSVKCSQVWFRLINCHHH